MYLLHARIHPDDPDCHHLYQALLSAASVVAKADNSRVMRLFVIQLDDISEVADLKVWL